MAHDQEEGWPLGLQPMHVRVELAAAPAPASVRDRELPGSVSFNTLVTGSPSSSTDFSSDLDTESTGSFFHDRSITLGNLIGINSILELSRRSLRGRKTDQISKNKMTTSNTTKFRLCLFSLCSTDSTDGENVSITRNPPSLGQFLAEERRAAMDEYRRNPQIYGPDAELAMAEQAVRETHSLFVDGQVAPPQSIPWFDSNVDRRKPTLFSCLC